MSFFDSRAYEDIVVVTTVLVESAGVAIGRRKKWFRTRRSLWLFFTLSLSPMAIGASLAVAFKYNAFIGVATFFVGMASFGLGGSYLVASIIWMKPWRSHFYVEDSDK